MAKDRHWRDVFRVASGEVWGSSYDHPDREARLRTDVPADIVLVLFDHDDPAFGRWTATGRAAVVRRVFWPKLATPPEPAALSAYLKEIRATLRDGGRAEVICFGGHGRTGTALASLAACDGEPPAVAIARVRRDTR